MQTSAGAASALGRHLVRRGPDHRELLGGVIPDFLTIRQWFDFNGVAIGRWVTRAEQELAAGFFFDALSDLVQILAGRRLQSYEQIRLGQLLVSLRGTLGLQYGTGGRPGVAAHYDPARRTFSLAKNAGPGSIAHEWFHAFDHFIADKAFDCPDSLRLGAGLWLEQPMRSHPLNDQLAACYRAVMLNDDGSATPLVLHSRTVDQALGQCYFSRPEELMARSFEAFVQDAGITNTFLVRGTRNSDDARLGLYPQGEQRMETGHAFATYFAALCEALLRQSDLR